MQGTNQATLMKQTLFNSTTKNNNLENNNLTRPGIDLKLCPFSWTHAQNRACVFLLRGIAPQSFLQEDPKVFRLEPEYLVEVMASVSEIAQAAVQAALAKQTSLGGGAFAQVPTPHQPRADEKVLVNGELKSICRIWKSSGSCRFGATCRFAHIGGHLGGLDNPGATSPGVQAFTTPGATMTAVAGAPAIGVLQVSHTSVKKKEPEKEESPMMTVDKVKALLGGVPIDYSGVMGAKKAICGSFVEEASLFHRCLQRWKSGPREGELMSGILVGDREIPELPELLSLLHGGAPQGTGESKELMGTAKARLYTRKFIELLKTANTEPVQYDAIEDPEKKEADKKAEEDSSLVSALKSLADSMKQGQETLKTTVENKFKEIDSVKSALMSRASDPGSGSSMFSSPPGMGGSPGLSSEQVRQEAQEELRRKEEQYQEEIGRRQRMWQEELREEKRQMLHKIEEDKRHLIMKMKYDKDLKETQLRLQAEKEAMDQERRMMHEKMAADTMRLEAEQQMELMRKKFEADSERIKAGKSELLEQVEKDRRALMLKHQEMKVQDELNWKHHQDELIREKDALLSQERIRAEEQATMLEEQRKSMVASMEAQLSLVKQENARKEAELQRKLEAAGAGNEELKESMKEKHQQLEAHFQMQKQILLSKMERLSKEKAAMEADLEMKLTSVTGGDQQEIQNLRETALRLQTEVADAKKQLEIEYASQQARLRRSCGPS